MGHFIVCLITLEEIQKSPQKKVVGKKWGFDDFVIDLRGILHFRHFPTFTFLI